MCSCPIKEGNDTISKTFGFKEVLTGGRKWCQQDSESREENLRQNTLGIPTVCKHRSIGQREWRESWAPGVVRHCAEIIIKLVSFQTWLLSQLRSGSRSRKIYWDSKSTTAYLSLAFTCLLLGPLVIAEFAFQFCLNSWN